MRIEQRLWSPDGWDSAGSVEADLVLLFAAPERLRDERCYAAVRAAYPQALIAGCSTAGEIRGTRVLNGSAVVTAIKFEYAQVKLAAVDVCQRDGSRAAGRQLAAALEAPGLRHVLIFSDGLLVNGSALAAGLQERLPAGVVASGGLAADGAHFGHTLVCADAPAREGVVVAIGLYGDGLKVGCGSLGGWDPFGPQRLITRAEGNVLFELDGQSALALYKQYLGEHAAGLPATALLFPLALCDAQGVVSVIRTVLAVDEGSSSMTFAGDMPEGTYARLMKANFERLVDGAEVAARSSLTPLMGSAAEFALLISCVGRKLVLQQRIEEEVEAAQGMLDSAAVLAGFYSYGELAPTNAGVGCELHNQTMTVITLSER